MQFKRNTVYLSHTRSSTSHVIAIRRHCSSNWFPVLLHRLLPHFVSSGGPTRGTCRRVHYFCYPTGARNSDINATRTQPLLKLAARPVPAVVPESVTTLVSPAIVSVITLPLFLLMLLLNNSRNNRCGSGGTTTENIYSCPSTREQLEWESDDDDNDDDAEDDNDNNILLQYCEEDVSD